MYYNLQDIYRNDSRIKFIVNNSYHNNVQLYNNYIIRFHHGDALRYGGGIGGITVPTNKAIAQWNQQTKVDIDVFGHFHQMHDGGNFICNGSLIGMNPYAINIKASYEVPTQTFFVVDKERGKTFVAPIFVTEPDKRVKRI